MGLIDLFLKKGGDGQYGREYYEGLFNEQWLPVIRPSNPVGNTQKDEIARLLDEGEDAILEAVFKQYELAFKHRNVTPSTAGFNQAEELDWTQTPNSIFELYKDICAQNSITPLELDSFSDAQKIPYIPIHTLLDMTKNVAICYLHLRKMGVNYIKKMSVYPSDKELMKYIEKSEDETTMSFLYSLLCLLVAVDCALLDYDKLRTGYHSFVAGFFCFTMKDKSKLKIAETHFQKAVSIFEEILHPYTVRLKENGVFDDKWDYSYNDMPLTPIPYAKIFGEKRYFEIGHLWNQGKARENAAKMSFYMDGNIGDIMESMYEDYMNGKFPEF